MSLDKFFDDFLHTEGFQLLTRDLYEVFDCPIMLIDVAFRVVSWYHGGAFQDKLFQGTIDRGELSYEIGSIFLGDHPPIQQEAQYIKLPDSPYQRRFSALNANRVHVGYMVLVDIHNNLDQVDPRIFSRVEASLAKQLMVRLSRASQLKNSEEAVLLHLLEGRYPSEALFRLQAETAGLTRFQPARCALVNLDLYRTVLNAENELRHAFCVRYPDSRMLIFNGNLLIFLNQEPDQAETEAFCQKYRLRMLISPHIHNLFHLQQGYVSMHEIMEFLITRISGPFALYTEPYYGLMMFRHLDSRRDLILPAVRAMGKHDKEEDSLYCLTLYTYLCCHHSLKDTCEQLFTHRNTILYRIRKMKEDYSIPLEDPSQHAALLMSCGLELLELDPNSLLP